MPRNESPLAAVVRVMKPRLDRREITYLTQGRERRRQRSRTTLWLLALGVVATVLASAMLLSQASASGTPTPTDCPNGAISAIGPVDAQGLGDTTPDVSCIEP